MLSIAINNICTNIATIYQIALKSERASDEYHMLSAILDFYQTDFAKFIDNLSASIDSSHPQALKLIESIKYVYNAVHNFLPINTLVKPLEDKDIDLSDKEKIDFCSLV